MNTLRLGLVKETSTLGFIYIRVKANAKATSLLTCCIVSDLCIYTTATVVAANIKEKNRFRVRFGSNINEPLLYRIEIKVFSGIPLFSSQEIPRLFAIFSKLTQNFLTLPGLSGKILNFPYFSHFHFFPVLVGDLVYYIESHP